MAASAVCVCMEPWQRLDRADAAGARELLRACCGSARWVDRMIGRRPFGSRQSLLAACAGRVVRARRRRLARGLCAPSEDWRSAAQAGRFAATRHLSRVEQKGVEAAGDDLLRALADANRLYEQTFGYIFIVCARGRTAEEMLGVLHARLRNDPDVEILVAASEQADITALRLEGI